MTTAVINTPVRTISLFASAFDANARIRLDAIESVTIIGAGLAAGGGDLTADRVITVPKASGAEAETGIDDTKAITPLALATPIATLQAAIDDEIAARIDGDASAPDNLAAHLADLDNPHSVTKAQVGLSAADNTSDANKPVSIAQATAINVVAVSLATHVGDVSNPHSVTKAQIGLSNADNTSDANKPVSIATQTVLNTFESDIDAVTAALDDHIADISNPHAVTKTQVGLGLVDNTSDSAKPVSSAQQTAINLVQEASDAVADDLAAHLADVANPHDVTATQVGLGSVNNTADVNKPISIATQTALNTVQTASDAVADDLAAHLADVANPHDVTAAQLGLGSVNNTADVNKPISIATQTALNTVQAASDAIADDLAAHLADLSNPHEVTAAQLGLGSVDNTADADKPVSTAQQTALNLKATIVSVDAVTAALDAHMADVANPHDVTAAQVGLGAVNNTSDADKPISTAAQIAIDAAQTDADAAQTDATQALADAAAAQADATQALADAATAQGTADAAQADATEALVGIIPVPSLVERASERPGDAWAIYGTSAVGDQSEITRVSQAWVNVNDSGTTLRIVGSALADPRTIAAIGAYAIEGGLSYEIRYKVRRRVDPLDPLNDSVTCGIRWLDSNKDGISGLAGTTTIDDIPLVIANGEQTRIGRISALEDVDDAILPPAGAVYFRPFISLYGMDHVTDVIAIETRSYLDNGIFSQIINVIGGDVTTPDYTLLFPTDGQSINVGTKRKTILSPAGTLSTLTLNLPDLPDKREIRITTRERIDELTVTSSGGHTVDWIIGELAQNAMLDFTFVTGVNAWVRA